MPNSNYRYKGCISPLCSALLSITGKMPPFDLYGVYCASELSDDLAGQLEDWCSVNASPYWATGGGVLEAAELLVDRAVENANLPPHRDRVGADRKGLTSKI